MAIPPIRLIGLRNESREWRFHSLTYYVDCVQGYGPTWLVNGIYSTSVKREGTPHVEDGCVLNTGCPLLNNAISACNLVATVFRHLGIASSPPQARTDAAKKIWLLTKLPPVEIAPGMTGAEVPEDLCIEIYMRFIATCFPWKNGERYPVVTVVFEGNGREMNISPDSTDAETVQIASPGRPVETGLAIPAAARRVYTDLTALLDLRVHLATE